MELSLFFRGMIVGIAVAAPVGPIAVLVIRRSLADGAFAGFSTGLGAAVADAIFALLGGLGLVGAASGLGSHAGVLRVLGGIALVVIGLRGLFGRAPPPGAVAVRAPPVKAFVGTLLLTLTSPITILSFAAIAASLGVGGKSSGALLLTLGVFVGSAMWWALLSGGVSAIRRRVPDGALRWLNRGAGLAIISFGLAAIYASGI